MKKTLLLLSFFILSFGYSQDWEMLFEIEGATYYYKPNTDDNAWIKIVSAKTEYYPDKFSKKAKIVDGHKILLWKFDCRNKKIGIIKTSTYSKDGKMLYSDSINEFLAEMDYVNPDSVGDALLTVFCDRN